MHQIIYVSSSSYPNMSPMDLKDILEASVRNNRKVGVTGALLYYEDSFMQLLEGDKEAVEGIFSAIKKDRRHKHIIVLVNDSVEERAFPDFSMICRKLSESDCIADPECRKILRDGFTSPHVVNKSNVAISLLNSFFEHNSKGLKLI